MTNQVAIITADLATPMEINELPDDTLEFLQSKVGGLVSCVQTRHFDVWVNDEGLLVQEPLMNLRASMLAGYPLAGDAVLAGCSPDGETIGLPPHIVKLLERLRDKEIASFEEDPDV